MITSTHTEPIFGFMRQEAILILTTYCDNLSNILTAFFM